MKIVLVSGGFDPLHSGHIEYFKSAKALGDKLVVGVNSDAWLTRKKGSPFMPLEERVSVIKELECVDEVITFNDDDDTAIQAIEKVFEHHNYDPNIRLVFANGGDRKQGNVPEENHYYDDGQVSFAFGVGGENKKNSSSCLLDKWKTQKTERDWGYWRVLDNNPKKGYKVKELVLYPGQSLSDQRHFKRSENWTILEGIVKMETEYNNILDTVHLTPSSYAYDIGKEVWHKASNPGTENAHVLEIQRGTECIEEDIERRDR